MAEDVVSKIRIEADVAQAISEFNQLKDSIEKMAEKAPITAAAWNKIFEVSQQAAGAIVQWFTDGAKAAMEYEQVSLRLSAALTTTGHEVEQNKMALAAQAAEFERIYAISEETIISLQSYALVNGVAANQIESHIKAAHALSSVTGGDLQSSLRELIFLQETGETRSKELKLAFEGLTAEQIKNSDVMEVVSSRFKAFADADLESTAKSVEKLGSAFDNLAKAFGEIAVESGAIRVIDSVTDSINRLSTALSQETFKTLASLYAQSLAAPIMGPIGAALGLDLTGRAFGTGEQAVPEAIGNEPMVGLGGGSGGLGSWGTGVSDKDRKKSSSDSSAAKDKIIEQMNKERDLIRELADLEYKAQMDRLKIENDAADAALKITESKNQRISKLESDYEKGLSKLKKDWADQRLEIYKKQGEDEDKLREKRIKAEKDQAKEIEIIQNGLAAMGEKTFMTFANAGLNALFTLAEGGNVAWDQVVKSTLKGLGTQLIGQGMGDLFKGASRALGSYGLDPTSEGLLVLGGAEVVAGAAMAAGSMAIGGSSLASAGGGNVMKGGGKSAPSFNEAISFSGGSVGTNQGSAKGGGDRNITININGPSLNSPQMGVAIRDALSAAAKVGV